MAEIRTNLQSNTYILRCYLFLVYFSLVFVLYFLYRFFPQMFCSNNFNEFCSTLPLQLSSEAHVYVSNSFISLHLFNLSLQMCPCFTLSYLHLPLNFRYLRSQLSNAYGYLIITHASLLITVYNSSQCVCSSCLLLSHVQTTHYQTIHGYQHLSVTMSVTFVSVLFEAQSYM